MTVIRHTSQGYEHDGNSEKHLDPTTHRDELN